MPKSKKMQQTELSRVIEEAHRLAKISLENAKKHKELVFRHCELVNKFLRSMKEPEVPGQDSSLKLELDWVYKHIVPGVGVIKSLNHNYSDIDQSMIIQSLLENGAGVF